MKSIHVYLKVIAIFISVLVLFQGCTVYRSNNSTLNEAYGFNDKVKIKTYDNQTLRFKSVTIIDGEYYGVLKKTTTTSSFFENTLLNEDDIKSIRFKNKPVSTILGIVTPIIILAVVIGLSFIDMDLNWNFNKNRVH